MMPACAAERLLRMGPHLSCAECLHVTEVVGSQCIEAHQTTEAANCAVIRDTDGGRGQRCRSKQKGSRQQGLSARWLRRLCLFFI